MGGDVPANSIAENIFAKKTLQHSQKRLAFFVGDIIESTVGFHLCCDALVNRVSRRPRVAFHRLLFGNTDAPGGIARQVASQPDLPLRIEMRRAFSAHP